MSVKTKRLINTSLEEKEKLKEEYENKISNLINQFKGKKDNEILVNNEDDDTISNENIFLIEENERIKKENESLINKLKNFDNLEKQYNDLLMTFSEIKEQNEILKQESKNKENEMTQKMSKKSIDEIEIPHLNINTGLNQNHSNKDFSNLIYNKKKPKKIRLSSSKNKLILNETKKERDNMIDESFNLYKPIKEGLLSFNLARKDYNLVIPENYQLFWNNYEQENSIQYNTLEGLFIMNSKDNQLYYYSSKKNTFCELFYFNYDHKEGCLFLDNLSKNIIAIGGINTTKVEIFSFEQGIMDELPELRTHRYKMSCCQVDNKIYCFFGLSLERENESLIEYLDIDNINNGWIELVFQNKTSFNLLTYMSCVNLNDSELLIIGGLIEDNVPNQKLLYYNIQKNEFIELNKDLPESDVKKYLFSQNIMFNLFIKENIISFINIDDNNQVHILDNNLKYDLYLPPKL